MKKFLLSLLAVFATTSAFAAEAVETLTTSSFWPKISSYTNSYESDEEFLGTTWKAASFNNNNNQWTNIRCGSNKNATTASISNNSAVSVAVSKLVINTEYIQTADIGKINSVSLSISKSSTFPESATTKVAFTGFNTGGDWTFDIPADVVGFNQYYKVEIDCQKSSKNGFLAVNSLLFTTQSTIDFPNPFDESYELVKGTTKNFVLANDAPVFTSATSTDESIAVYDITTNEIKGINAGEATITVKWDEQNTWNAGSASFKVIVSSEGVTEASIVIDPAEYTVMIGETLNVEYLYDGDGKLTLSSSDESVATATLKDDVIEINALTRGKVTFTVTAEKTDNYTSAKASFVVEVKVQEYSESLNFPNLELDNATVLTEYEVGRVDFEFSTGNGSTDPAYYTSGTAARIYTGNTMTISVPNGYFLISVEFSVTQGSVSGTFSSGDYNSGKTTWFAGKDTNIVRYTHSGSQVRFSNIKVTYAKASDLLGEIFEPSAFNDFMLNIGEDLKLDLGESHPEIRYTFEGDKISIDKATNTITALKPGSVKVIAAWDAVEGEWIAGSEKFTVFVKYATLADVLKDAQNPDNGYVKAGEVYVGNFPVTIVSDNGFYNYVTDGTAWALFYVNHEHNDGDILPAGWSGIYTEEHGVPEFNNIKHDEIEDKGTVELEEFNEGEITADRVNQVLILNEVKIDTETPATQSTFEASFAGKTYTFYNLLRLSSVEAGFYNVKAVVDLDEGELVIDPIEYTALEATTAVAHVDAELKVGEEIKFTGLEEGAHVYYRHGGENPDHTNVFTEEVTPADAPRKAATADVNTEWTYNHTTHPLVYNGQPMTVKYYAKAPGKAPSAVNELNVDENGSTTGIENIAVDAANGAVEYFNLQGIRVVNPENGVFIRRQGNEIKKVIL